MCNACHRRVVQVLNEKHELSVRACPVQYSLMLVCMLTIRPSFSSAVHPTVFPRWCLLRLSI